MTTVEHQPPSPDAGSTTPPRWWQRVWALRWRWLAWFAGLGVVMVVAAVVVATVAPGYLHTQLEQRLSASWGATVEIESVEVRWIDLVVDVQGLRIEDGVRLTVEVDRIEAEVSWRDLVRGVVRPEVVLHQPVVVLGARAAPARPDSQQGLDDFESVQVVDGSLRIDVPTTTGSASVMLTDIRAQLEPRETATPSALTDLSVEVSATVGEQGTLTASGRLSSQTPAAAWNFRFDLDHFALPSLNPLWIDLVEMDVEHGLLSLDGELARSPARLRGRIRPRFEELALLGADEDALHPMAEALFGHMLMGARSTITIDREMTGDRGSSLPELLATDWQTLIQDVIKRGYARRLSTLRGYSATIGDVHVDFGKGLLQLMDVVIDAEAPVIDIPLVAIERVDVVFDPAVTQAGTPAYKHVLLHRPTLTFATGVEGSESRLQFDESWLDTISAIPFATRDLVVHQGRIDVWDARGEQPVNVFVSDIELSGEQMARDLHAPGVRGAELSGTGTVMGEALASINVVYEPRAAVPNVDVDMVLEPVELTTLAPALQVFVEVDAVGGQMGFSAHLDVRNYEVQATVVPRVHRPQLRVLGSRRIRKIIISRALRRMRSHAIEIEYTMEPDEGLLHAFFPELIQAVFLGR